MRYRAFLSYSHADATWAAWLHKALESYRVPKRLVGQRGSHGAVPARLTPIFRDREELSSGADLSEHIKDALKASDSLIVVCSPASANSRWVNEEIRQFRSLGDSQRIYCVIVDGDPQAADPNLKCFPPALLEDISGRTAEPLAADARKWADGKALAKLKIASGLLGVRLDELRQREQQRKRKIQIVFGVALLAVTALVVISIQSRMSEREALMAREAQQAAAESMLAGFLEQSDRLGEVADIRTRKAFLDILSEYLEDLDPADLTAESRRQLGVTLVNQGVILRDQEQLDDAMEAFSNAYEVLKQLVDDSNGDTEALFELSQVHYWIGQLNLDMGNMQEASKGFEAYAKVSDTLYALRPQNADWAMEAAYAQSNLGNLESMKIPSDPQVTLDHHQAALELNEEAARLDKTFEAELAESHANVADAWLDVCGLQQAMDHRLKNVELSKKHHDLNRASNLLKQDYAYALSGLTGVQLMTGQLRMALENIRHSRELMEDLVESDPENLRRNWNRVIRAAIEAQILELAGQSRESRELSLSAKKDMRDYLTRSSEKRLDYTLDYGVLLRDFAYRSYREGEVTNAHDLLEESVQQFSRIIEKHPNNKNALIELARTYFYYWEQHEGQLPDSSAVSWLSDLKESLNVHGCSQMDTAARISVMLDEPEKAKRFVDQLLDKGYRHPEFMRFCAEYGLCSELNVSPGYANPTFH